MQSVSQNGVAGMVYRGDPALIHVSDGKRAEAGQAVAKFVDKAMRQNAQGRDAEQIWGDFNGGGPRKQALCPGCYMVVLYDAAIALADANGQSRRELAASLSEAFAKLAADPSLGYSEEIHVLLDPCEPEVDLANLKPGDRIEHKDNGAVSLAEEHEAEFGRSYSIEHGFGQLSQG